MIAEEKQNISQQDAVALATEKLGISTKTASCNCQHVDKIDGYYIWNPTRGGASILINGDGDFLYASSAIGFDKLLEAFNCGRRS